MAVEGGTKVIKYLLFIFNLLFLLAGIALIIIGAVATAKLAPYTVIAGVKFNGVGVFLIIIGIVVFLISFFGCLGAYKENYCLLVTFIIFMIIALLALVAAIITAFVMRNKLTNLIEDNLHGMIPNYKSPNDLKNATTKLWDEIQIDWHCCGANNSYDWLSNQYLNKTASVPESCCVSPSAGCGQGKARNPSGIYTKGCATEISAFIHNNVVAVGGAAAAIAILQFIGIVFAACLAHGIRKGYSTV